MEDYLGDLESVTGQIEAARGAHPIVCGWSMGGMLSMMYAAKHDATPALVLLEPSPPVEISGRVAPEVVRRFSGDVLGPEALGVFPENRERSRPMLLTSRM
jgi:pimeloyl-ACP methyl ester carboxylesterase